MDYRLAGLRDEIEKIMSAGPIGHWSNVPTTYPFNTETVVFDADGTGVITTWSALSGKSMQSFTWSIETPGRIVMRYRLTRYGAQVREDAPEPDDSPELAPIAFRMEVVVQESEQGAWPTLVSEGSDVFDGMRAGLARTEPPLRLPAEAVPPPPRSFLSRVRSLVFGAKSGPHADA